MKLNKTEKTRTENPCVGGSIPPHTTALRSQKWGLFYFGEAGRERSYRIATTGATLISASVYLPFFISYCRLAIASNGGNTPSFLWLVDGISSGVTGVDFTSSSLNNGDSVNCIMTGSLSCSAADSSAAIYMQKDALPTIPFDPDTVYTTNNIGVELSPIIAGSGETYRWSPASGLSDSAIPDPLATPASENIYTPTVTTPDGCTGVGKVTVIAGRPLEMPNAFTPNGDGHNDVFRIPPGVQFDLGEFDIFDRWGNRIFSTANISMGWDGTYNGHSATLDLCLSDQRTASFGQIRALKRNGDFDKIKLLFYPNFRV